jgi:hypothetical protein
MAKASSRKAGAAARDIVPHDKRKIDLTKFKPDLSAKDWAEIFKPGVISPIPVIFLPIETLTPAKTRGLGRTNLTFIMPTIVQVDATTPHASFNRQVTPSRNPVIQMHFEPGAYGITTVGSYVMNFTIDVSGQSTFTLAGNPGITLSGAGSKVVSGQRVVTLIFKNVPPAQHLFGFLEQTAGGPWTWFSTRVTYPPLVIGAGL